MIRATSTLRFIVRVECLYVFPPCLILDTTGDGSGGYASAVDRLWLVAGVLTTSLEVPGRPLAFAMVGWQRTGVSFGRMCLTTQRWVVVALTAGAGAAMSIQTILLWSLLHEAGLAEFSGRVYAIWRLGADGALKGRWWPASSPTG